MRNPFKKLAILIIAISSCYCGYSQAYGDSKKIVIIRHGEKPANGNNLSCMGQNRSIQLVKVLENKFKKINSIYVPALNNGRTTNQSRMFQTITPYAIKHNLDINTGYTASQEKGVASDVGSLSGTILVVWEHNGIPKLVKALGISEKQQWDDDDYDSIWIISWTNGKAILTKDAQNIKPLPGCNN